MNHFKGEQSKSEVSSLKKRLTKKGARKTQQEKVGNILGGRENSYKKDDAFSDLPMGHRRTNWAHRLWVSVPAVVMQKLESNTQLGVS